MHAARRITRAAAAYSADAPYHSPRGELDTALRQYTRGTYLLGKQSRRLAHDTGSFVGMLNEAMGNQDAFLMALASRLLGVGRILGGFPLHK